jgi:hypothetical protein
MPSAAQAPATAHTAHALKPNVLAEPDPQHAPYQRIQRPGHAEQLIKAAAGSQGAKASKLLHLGSLHHRVAVGQLLPPNRLVIELAVVRLGVPVRAAKDAAALAREASQPDLRVRQQLTISDSNPTASNQT